MCKVPLRFCSVFEKQGNSLEPAIYNLYLLKPISTPTNSEAAASLHPNATDQGTPQRGPILSAICETIPGQSQKDQRWDITPSSITTHPLTLNLLLWYTTTQSTVPILFPGHHQVGVSLTVHLFSIFPGGQPSGGRFSSLPSNCSC